MIALYSYAIDNDRTFPARNPNAGGGYPHETKRIYNSPYDLNEPFIDPYLGDRIIVFCPSLLDLIDPSMSAFEERFASTQYHVWPEPRSGRASRV